MKHGKHAAFLFALVIPVLFVSCTPYLSLYDALTSAKTRDTSNPFVGLWLLERTRAGIAPPVYNNNSTIYKFADDNRWESYAVYPDGTITPRLGYNGTYSYRGSVLYITYTKVGYGYLDGVLSSSGDPLADIAYMAHIAASARRNDSDSYGVIRKFSKWRLGGNELRPDPDYELKLYKTTTILRRVSEDCSDMEQILEQRPS